MAAATENINFRLTAQDQASAVLRNLQTNMSSISTIGEKFGRIMGALGVGLSLQQAASAMKNLIDKADGFKDISQKTGVAVETLSKFSQIAENSGTSLDSVAVGFKKLSASMISANAGNREMIAIFDALNVEFKDSQGNMRDVDDVMLDVADRFTTLEDGALKSATAVKIFGKSGTELIPMLNEGSEAVNKFQSTIDAEFAESADKFNENINEMSNRLEEGLVKSLKTVLPFLNDFFDLVKNQPSVEAVADGLELLQLEKQLDSVNERLATELAFLDKMQIKLKEATAGGFINQQDSFRNEINLTLPIIDNYRDQIDKLTKQIALLGGVTDAVGVIKIPEIAGDLRPPPGSANYPAVPVINTKALATAVGGGTGGTDELKKFLEDQKASIELLKLEGQQASMTALDYKLLTDQQKFKSELDKLLIGKSGEKVDAFRAEAMALEQTKLELIKANAFYKQSIEGGFMEGLAKIREKAMDVGGQISDAMTNAFSGMEDALVSFVMTGKADFKSLANSIISDLIRIQIRSMLGGLFGGGGGFNLGSLLGFGGGIGGRTTIAGGALGGLRANGGPVSANRQYIVGEKGPELFMSGSSGSIVPNNALGGNSGGGVTINQTINVSTGVQQTVRAEIQQLLPQISNAAKNAVVDAKRRGGSFAMAFGG